MRIYHKVRNDQTGEQKWLVLTDQDDVYVFWLVEVLRLVLGESPFFANWGIPATETIVTNIYPDYYVALVKDQFTPYFQSLNITRIDTKELRTAAYSIEIITLNGKFINEMIKVTKNDHLTNNAKGDNFN